MNDRPTPELVVPRGFSFSSVCAGIKVSGRPDLALIECSPGTSAAAVFTQNRVVAAPVVVGRESLRASRGKVRAVVVNSGNANCANGAQGLRGCRLVCKEAARIVGTRAGHVFPSSTGIIGVPLPAENILVRLPDLIASHANTAEAALKFAHTIMTTDTRAKIACQRALTRNGEAHLLGLAKGAGMIHPNLATMLVYLMTDAVATPAQLKRILVEACDQTFNCISIDGDTSTNDTVLLLASGQSHFNLKDSRNASTFAGALLGVCESLAEQIVQDGEGVKHVIRLSVEGAKNRHEAMQAAQAIAYSPLCKTAWAGADPNWGRILAAVGRSGIAVDAQRISIFIGKQKVFHRGQSTVFDEKAAHEDLAQPACNIRIQLGRGRANLRFLTTDLTSEYVHINADYST
jgi:glutamate N-acetyltransferase / amino-acid N-acetyltransferase